LLQRAAETYQRLLFPIETTNQWRCRRSRVLPARAVRLLHHVPGAHASVLSEPILVMTAVTASIVAGWSALYGP
jgi:hypothetical protein